MVERGGGYWWQVVAGEGEGGDGGGNGEAKGGDLVEGITLLGRDHFG